MAPPPLAVLVVEDDDGIGGGLLRALRGQGYDAVWAKCAADALDQTLARFDVILLDLGLPDMDGLDLCRRLHNTFPGIPILILTARGSEADIVVGLDAGADDYLIKPFRLAELLARLRANTRRLPDRHGQAISVGDISVDLEARRVHVGTREVPLRAKEYDLLVLFMTNAGKVVTREKAMSEVWDEHWFGSSKTLDVHVAALRQRLGENNLSDSRITTLRGVGYRMEEQSVPPGER